MNKKTTLQAYIAVLGFLVQAQKRAVELFISYSHNLDKHPDNEIAELEKGLVDCIDKALEMVPMTPAIMEKHEEQMVEILEYFVPPQARMVESQHEGRQVPLTSMN